MERDNWRERSRLVDQVKTDDRGLSTVPTIVFAVIMTWFSTLLLPDLSTWRVADELIVLLLLLLFGLWVWVGAIRGFVIIRRLGRLFWFACRSAWSAFLVLGSVVFGVIVFLGVYKGLTDRLNPRWEGFVYPDRDNLAIHRELGQYNSLEECRDACWSALTNMNATVRGDYECGKNCRTETDLSIRVCEETTR